MTAHQHEAAPFDIANGHELPKTTSQLVGIPLCIVFGACTTLSFAPADAWWFTPLCIAGLFFILRNQKPLHACTLGFSFGIGWFTAGFWWIAPGLNNFSKAGAALSYALTVVLVMYMALFAAAGSAALAALQPRKAQLFSRPLQCFTAASLWALSEWLRAHLFGGLPWLTTGYSQAPGPLSVFAPVVGVFGLTFIVALLAAILADCLDQLNSGDCWKRAIALPWAALVVLACGGFILDKVQWSQDTGRKLSVRLLQGNLPQHDKFTVTGLRRALSTYGAMLQTTTADLTALPETALPIEWLSLPDEVRQAWQDFATESNTAIVLGTVASSPIADGASHIMTNSAVALAPGDSVSAPGYRYDKRHLVPFGEAMPQGAGWLGQQLRLDFGSFTPGPANQRPLILPAAKIALSICFEDLFDTEIADKAKDAEVILNISNFAWFSHTYAPAQHLQAARMRALETGRWVLHASNTGMTALIDQRGEVRDALAPNATAYLDGTADLYEGSTPFMVAQNRPLIGMSLLFILISARQRSVRASTPVSSQSTVTSINSSRVGRA